jgi:protein tyrosine/serine phosphatase
LSRDRVLVWDGCVNVRDLGGLPLRAGGETQFGVVVRADSLAGLTDAGWEALADYGVTRAVDLRADHELGDQKPLLAVTRVPIAPTGVAWEWPSMLEAYLALLEEWRPRFAQAVDAIAAAPPPIVVHCAGGRDRTGLVTALVLDAAGVVRAAIAADHARSDESWAPHNDGWFASAPDDQERERRRRISQPAGRTLAEVLEEIEQREGIRNRLLAAGAEEVALDRLVARLRGEA